MSKNIKPARRSGEAVAAQHRRAGFMHDRRAQRGGQRNAQRDLADQTTEAYDDADLWDW